MENKILELKLLKLLLAKDNYQSFAEHIDYGFLKESSTELFYLYKTLASLHEKHTQDLSLDELEGVFFAQYPDAKKEVYNAVFQQLKELDISTEVGHEIIKSIVQKKNLLTLSEKAYRASQASGAEAETALRDVVQIADSLGHHEEVASDSTVFVTTDLEEILHDTIQQRGLRWRLDCLNKSLGSLRTGDFGFIFARPETGKTTFLASECSAFLNSVSGPIIWFNNEEQGKKVMLRVIQAYFGLTKEQLLASAAIYKQRFNDEVGSNFLLVDDPAIEKTRVERICEKYQPSLIIYDQIDKIKGFKADRDDLVYGAIYQWARELAKTYAPTIGVCQADGTAEGQKWLHMGNVANAKTSKQAEADFILGIGKTADEAAQAVRYINISKNKLVGDDDSIPDLRHGRFEVLIQPEIARYKDVIKYS